MTEINEGGEGSRNLSKDEVIQMRDLANKIWEVTTLDLEKYCGTTEEIDIVKKAQDAMSEVMAMFDMPLDDLGNWNRQEAKTIAPKSFSPDDLQRLHTNLESIKEFFEWDLGAFFDEPELSLARHAKESLETLEATL